MGAGSHSNHSAPRWLGQIRDGLAVQQVAVGVGVLGAEQDRIAGMQHKVFILNAQLQAALRDHQIFLYAVLVARHVFFCQGARRSS